MEGLKIPRLSTMNLYNDSKSTIRITHDLMYYDKTKHVEVDHHFFKEEIENGVLSFSYVSTEIQANIAMKAQSKLGFD